MVMRNPNAGGGSGGARKVVALVVLAGAGSRLPGYLADAGTADGKAIVLVAGAIFAALVLAYGFWPVGATR